MSYQQTGEDTVETIEVMRILVSLSVVDNFGKKAVSCGYDAEIPVKTPDLPLRKAIDRCAEICNAQINPHLPTIATISCHISQMNSLQSIVLFGLSFQAIQRKQGPCIFSGKVVADETILKLKEGLVSEIGHACLRECIPVLTETFERWEYGSL